MFLLFKVWGRRAMWSYLVLSTPMLFVVYTGFDLVGVALAVSAAALVQRRHAVAGGLGFVVAAFTKLWPVALLPIAPRSEAGNGVRDGGGGRRHRPRGVDRVGRHGRDRRSAHLPRRARLGVGEPGRIAAADRHRRPATHRKWRRARSAPHLGCSASLLTVVLVGLVAEIWWLAAQRPNLAAGVAETAVITSLLVIGTLLSLQFVIWPLPFAAIAAASGAPRLERWAGAAALLTFADWTFFFNPAQTVVGSQIVILARNLALVGLLVAAILEIRKVAPAGRPARRASGVAAT